MDPVFTKEEQDFIAQMYKERKPSAYTAKVLNRSTGDVLTYIRAHLFKKSKPKAVINKPKPEAVAEEIDRVRKLRINGIRRYEDPYAAAEGSRKLLEALNAYFAKHRNDNP